MENLYLTIVLAPLAAAAVAGLLGKVIGRVGAHTVTIAGVAISFVLSVIVLRAQLGGAPIYNGPVYEWAAIGGMSF
ncbi:MAG TPA: NADH-quinone oxidoreductase subunit L, partial [Gammaproteobacteria bacterium]|nr:NADH-quinone oxidoreductase subunit L [Gammaproteobacteria bacterium]